MARRSNGEGTAYRDKKRGRWEGQVFIGGKRRKVTGPTKTDVLAKMSALRADEAAGVPVGDGATRVRDVVATWEERWLAGRDLAPSTVARHEWAVGLWREAIGNRKLRDLTVRDVERALDSIAADNGLSRGSLVKVRGTLGMVLDYAVKRRMVAANVARLADLPPDAARAKERRAFTPDEFRAFWRLLDGERMGALFRLMMATGLRPGEATALMWGDLDGDRLTVRRGVRLVQGHATLVDSLKTSTAYRTVTVPAAAMKVLGEHRQAVAAQQLAAEDWTDLALVFPNATGDVWSPSTVRNELAGICRRHGSPWDPPVRPNELRHAAATLRVESGAPLEQVADLLGHKDVRMVSSVYRHRVRPTIDASADAVDAVLQADLSR